jgi:hypothetical protein
MEKVTDLNVARIPPGRILRRALLLLLAISLFCAQVVAQQTNPLLNKSTAPAKAGELDAGPSPAARVPGSPEGEGTGPMSAGETRRDGPAAETSAASTTPSQFRIDRVPMVGGSELLTIFGRLDGMRPNGRPAPEVPLFSVVRDTLSDDDPENDRLRYVWMLTYTQPTMIKRIASAIPFFYLPVGSKTQASKGPPAPLLDLANTSRQTWNHFFLMGLQQVFLDSYGIPLKAASRSYRQNAADYRSAHVTQALSVLGNYEYLRQRSRSESELLASTQSSGPNTAQRSNSQVDDVITPLLPERSPGFTPGEMLELRARLILSGKTFGGLFGADKFSETVEKRSMNSVDIIGHNWELLRQKSEAEGLFFQPLAMPDGRATHVMVWIARSDLSSRSNRSFDRRFLNIANPWNDGRLRNWNGYMQQLYFDQDNRLATPDNPKARAMEMIPLAIYGLDHPKIPALLIDFRDTLNPKAREVSRRALNDLTRNIFSLSNFGNLPYFVGHTVYDFVTGRRGMDLNQPTRLASYSELKLLLAFNNTIDPKLRREIERRLEIVSVNPLSNDNQSEIQLARQQYDALISFARRTDGLPAKVARDRRAEMVPLKHGSVARFFITVGNVLSFGRYVHREDLTPELAERLDLTRRLERHTQFLSEVARSSPRTEVAWDINTVKRSLQFLADRGAAANGAAARATSLIFQRTDDAEARGLCLEALYKINNKTARNELLLLYRTEQPQSNWRTAIAEQLRKAVAEDPRLKPNEARAVLSQVGGQP